jgi:hypothetical protein
MYEWHDRGLQRRDRILQTDAFSFARGFERGFKNLNYDEIIFQRREIMAGIQFAAENIA